MFNNILAIIKVVVAPFRKDAAMEDMMERGATPIILHEESDDKRTTILGLILRVFNDEN